MEGIDRKGSRKVLKFCVGGYNKKGIMELPYRGSCPSIYISLGIKEPSRSFGYRLLCTDIHVIFQKTEKLLSMSSDFK